MGEWFYKSQGMYSTVKYEHDELYYVNVTCGARSYLLQSFEDKEEALRYMEEMQKENYPKLCTKILMFYHCSK